MLPELFRIGPFSVHSYGIMLALSFLIGIYIAVKKGEKRSIKSEEIVNLSFIIILSSVFGARLLYVLFHLNEFQGRWIYSFWPVQEDGTIGLGGLILLGGVLAAFMASALYIYYRKLNFLKIADSVAPAIALGIFFTRIGCYLNGCCFGKQCSPTIGVIFPAHSPAGSVMGQVPLYPTQLLSSLYGLIIFGVLMWIDRKKSFDGLLMGIFLILYGISRFTVDFFRYYESQMVIFAGLDFNQIVSLLMFLSGILIILVRLRKPRVA